MKRWTLTLALCSALAGAAQAQIHIDRAWARATAAGQAAGGGFLELHNAGAADRLVGAHAPGVAERVELHSMAMQGDVMRMRQVEAIALPAGGAVALEPGGLHLMLLGLKRPLQAGSRFALTLRFEKAGELAVEVEVRAATALPAKDSSPHRH